ncbi:MAG: hypothetical protein Q8T09_22700 [Candidatus Melainabacteria bacterium]|nr:hypothetical protein [Candidatus Melainabacteria bacterium]
MINEHHIERGAVGVNGELWTEKLLREGELLKSAGPGFANAAKDAIKAENLPATFGTVALSAGLGLLMARYAPMSGAAGALTRTGLASMTIAGSAEVAINGSKIAEALKDTWNSDQHWQQNVSVVQNSLGRFAFESALLTVGGLATVKLSGAAVRAREYTSYCKKRGHSDEEISLSLEHPQYRKPLETTTLQSLQKRLSGYTIRQEKFAIANPKEPGPFLDWDDFMRRAMKEISAPVREYNVKGLSTKIDVPEEYAKSLDQVRELRLAAEGPSGLRRFFSRGIEAEQARLKLEQHPHRYRALPEDLIPFLERTPDHSYAKRLLISDWDSPYSVFHHKPGAPFKTAPASANANGYIRTNKMEAVGSNEREMTILLNHEWAHMSKWKNKSSSSAFDAAADIEGKNYVLDSYALRNYDEHWAVHLGEGVLAPNSATFLEMVNKAPIRSAVLGRSLAESLELVPMHLRSPIHNFYVKRSEYIRDNVVPKALADLNSRIAIPNEQTELAKNIREYLIGAK